MPSATRRPLALARLERLRGLLRRVHRDRGDRRDLARVAKLLVALAWGPLAVMGLAGQLLRGQVEPILLEGAVHVRLLVALPLALLAGAVLDHRCRLVFERLANEGYLEDPRPAQALARSAEQWGRSLVVEAMLVAVAVLIGQHTIRGGATGPGLTIGTDPLATVGPAAAWYGLVSLPLLLYLATRVLWRWAVWTRVLWRLSRLPIATDPTHPDRAGGLNFLARPTDAIALLALGTSAIAAASWAPRLASRETTPASLALVFLTYFTVVLGLGVLPTLPFVGRLVRTFRQGLWDYDLLAIEYGRRFRKRWVTGPPGPGPEFLGTSDIQSLADLGNAYERIRAMGFLPFSRMQLTQLVVATVLPLVPLVFTQVPVAELLPRIARLLLGG